MENSEKITLNINNRTIEVAAGTTALAAVCLAGATLVRRSVSGEPRNALCGMGICFECCLKINGVSRQKSCQRLAENGMRIEIDE